MFGCRFAVSEHRLYAPPIYYTCHDVWNRSRTYYRRLWTVSTSNTYRRCALCAIPCGAWHTLHSLSCARRHCEHETNVNLPKSNVNEQQGIRPLRPRHYQLYPLNNNGSIFGRLAANRPAPHGVLASINSFLCIINANTHQLYLVDAIMGERC